MGGREVAWAGWHGQAGQAPREGKQGGLARRAAWRAGGGGLACVRACTYTGDQPAPLWWISSPSRPSILGTEGPQMSMSSSPTCTRGGRGACKL